MKYLITPAHLVQKYESVRQFKAIIENSTEIDYPDGETPSFDLLYAHRNALFIELARTVQSTSKHLMAWCSKRYSSGSLVEKGWFLMGVFDNRDPVVMKDISYHLPISLYREAASFCEEMFVAPEFDGHDSYDVLKRLKDICK